VGCEPHVGKEVDVVTIKTLDELNMEFMSSGAAARASVEIDEGRIGNDSGHSEIGSGYSEIDMGLPKIGAELLQIGAGLKGSGAMLLENGVDTEAGEQLPRTRSGGKLIVKKKRGLLKKVSAILFAGALLALLLSVVAASKYTFFNVMTSSMQDEIPKGALILVHSIDPQELEIGDNITFMRDWRTSVTHKIVGIEENHFTDGARGFITKGVNNAKNDERIVHADDIVGIVVFTMPVMGAVLHTLAANIYIIVAVFGLFAAVLMMVLVYKRRKAEAKAKNAIVEREG